MLSNNCFNVLPFLTSMGMSSHCSFNSMLSVLFISICLVFMLSIETACVLGNLTTTDVALSRVVRRNVFSKCSVKDDCQSLLPGSFCVNATCICPQGYLPSSKGKVGCFQTGKHWGDSCNTTIQCGDGTSCVNHVCRCPQGFQLFHVQQTNLCLLWHRPTRVVDRCRSNEDCLPLDPNSVCRKRWCQCRNGFQLFETLLFGRKHTCFKTYKKHCDNSSQCVKPTETYEQHCICHFGYCHCIANSNISLSDIYGWINEKPTWYQHWKKDIMLATRLLFITVVLFFIPCFVHVTRFVYVTLGTRDHGRGYCSRASLPVRSHGTVTQPLQNRTGFSRSRPRAVYFPEMHNVEIALSSRGVSSRLVENQANVPSEMDSEQRNVTAPESEAAQKEEDLPPSYEDIMKSQHTQESPPPPYREL